MRAGGAAADAAIADDLAALDAGAGNRGERRHVCIPGGDTKTVIHDYEAAVAGMVFDDRNDTVGGGVNRCAVVRCNVNARMECAFAAERIETFAKAIRDMAKYRPDRRRIRGIGKTERR